MFALGCLAIVFDLVAFCLMLRLFVDDCFRSSVLNVVDYLLLIVLALLGVVYCLVCEFLSFVVWLCY